MRTASRLAPPLALMALIFYLSAQEELAVDLGFIDLVLRKLAHMTEFGLLWLLWHRALGWRAPLAAASIAVGYAISDELHQSTVDGRHGTPVDVLIDTAGVALAMALTHRVRPLPFSRAGRAARRPNPTAGPERARRPVHPERSS